MLNTKIHGRLAFCCLLLGLFFCEFGETLLPQSESSTQSFQKDVLCQISAIPIADRNAIEGFFHLFLLKGGGAYTLFGDKPVSCDCYFEASSSDYSPFNRRYICENLRLRKGWKTFTKYHHLFSSKTFLLKGCTDDQGSIEVVLIHRQHFIDTVDLHLEDFKKILGNKINGKALLKDYETGTLSLFQLLKHNHALLGLLLGFGRANSTRYQQWIESGGAEKKGIKLVQNSQKEYGLTGAFHEMNHRKPYKFLYLPAFLAEEKSVETRMLQTKYLKLQKQIHKAYSHGNFLEITLEKYTQTSVGAVTQP